MTALARRSMVLVMLVSCGAPFVASLDLFIVNVALPDMNRSFSNSSLGELSWVLNAYVIVYAALLIPLGRCADAMGTRRVFVFGLIIFTVGSVVAAVSPEMGLLIGARIVQAIGSAALTPTSLGLLIQSIPEVKRAPSVRLWVASSAVGSALGPVIGGVLTEFSWRWVFLINVPVGILLVVAALKVLARGEVAQRKRAGLTGAVLSAIAVGGLSLVLVEGNDWGWLSMPSAVCCVVFVLAVWGLMIDTRFASAPLIPAEIVRVPSFAAANLAMGLFSMAFAAGLLGLSLWLQSIQNFTPLAAGLAVAPGPLMVPVLALGGQRLLGRMRPGARAALGSLIWAIGFILIFAGTSNTSNYFLAVLPGWVVAGVGVGLTLPSLLGAATIGLPSEYASSGSAVINVTRQIGTVIGTSILVAVLASDNQITSESFRIGWLIISALAVFAVLPALRVGSDSQHQQTN